MNIVNTFNDKVKNLNSKIKKIMNTGFKVSFVLCLLAILLLSIYQTMYALPNLFYAGISLLHSSFMFGCAFFAFGLGFDSVLKQQI